MPITNQQGNRKKLTPAQRAERERVDKANDAEVRRSINDWRASQGLPPLKEAPHG